ncbi:MAG: hypothetical protein IJK61_02675, partial [Bacteroidetes bacterium]|nr:hypothetical protein [Bacteroidota bacterium]
MKKFLIIITFLFFLSMLNSCTIVRYDYKTKDSISNEELEDFQYFFKKFKNKLKENNGSKDFIQKYVNYYTLNLEFNKLGKKDYESSFIFLYTNFISLVSAEYNDICMLSLEKNKNIYRNKNN